jgi:ubiquinol-cytochrome c reductase cytochrome b subunit
MFYGSYVYVYSVMWIGIVVFIVLMAIAYMGYVLPWGSMSYWGATVITNLLSSIPGVVPWVCGGFQVSSPTVSRYYIIHFILPVLVIGLLVFHVLYLHRLSSSSNPGYGTNNRIHFYTWLVCKDVLALVFGLVVVVAQVFYGVMVLAHPDNTLEVSVLYTPMHIVPEWYFLGFYSILKSIPGRSSGFLVMISYICVLNVYGEACVSSSLVGSTVYTGRYCIWCLLLVSVLYSLWIGVQLPQGEYISYGRGYLVVTIWYRVGYRSYSRYQGS